MKKPNKKQLLLLITAAAVLVAALITVLILATRDESDSEEDKKEIFSVSEFGTVQGKFTDRKITDESSAIEAVRDAAEILGLENASDDLTSKRTDKVDDLTYYRISQNYKGIPVYGSSFVVVADKNGETVCLSSHAKDIDEGISLIPTVTQEQINSAIFTEFENDDNIEIPEITDDMLVIYNPDDGKSAMLAYDLHITVGGSNYRAIVGAIDGECLLCVTLDYSNDLQLAVDKEKNITICNFNDNVFKNKENKCEDNIAVLSDSNDKANILLEYMQYSYDYFQKTFGIKGFNNNNGKTYAAYNCKFQNLFQEAYSNNAFSHNNSNNTITYLSFGSSIDLKLEVVAHEYMHSVEQATVGLEYKSESGAIMEAYSDLFGELIEDKYVKEYEYQLVKTNEKNNLCDWIHGEGNGSRNIYYPFMTNNPITYQGVCWQDENDTSKDNDYGGVHKNSTVISHAAYVMTQTDDGFTALSTEELAKLWYQAMLLITNPDCSFAELRNYIESAAINIDLSEKKQARVSSAFEAANIIYSEENVAKDFEIRIINPNNSKFYRQCIIIIEGKAKEGFNEDYEERIIPTSSKININLERGKYTVQLYDTKTDTVLLTRTINVHKNNKDKHVFFYVEGEEELPIETTLLPETTITPETTTIPETTVHVHSYVSTENAASCTKEVKVVHSCACGYSYTEILPMINHNYVNDVCSMCGLIKEVFSNGLDFKLNGDKKSYSIVGIGTCTDTEIVIPSEYQNLPVTKISDSAFYECNSIVSVIISDNITEIGRGAFNFCTNLKNITLSDSVVNIKANFGITRHNYKDAKINYAEYENGIYLGTADNPYYALITVKDANSYGNKNFNIHKDTKVIAQNAFSYSSYSTIILHEGLIALSDECFSNCFGDSVNITLPESIEYYGNNLFSYNKKNNLRVKLKVYENGYYIGTFSNPYKIFVFPISSDVTSCTMHKDTEVILGSAFYFSDKIESVNINAGLKTIGKNAFSSCIALKKINIPNSVQLIDDEAFSGCDSLKEIILPDSVTYLGNSVFYGCESLEKVYFGKGIEIIPTYTFSYCYALNNVNIHDNIKYIGENAFFSCNSMTSVEIGSGIEELDLTVFMGCSLSSIKINKTVKKITVGPSLWSNNSIIYYNGTISEWNEIETNDYWYYLTKTKEIQCTDGTIKY